MKSFIRIQYSVLFVFILCFTTNVNAQYLKFENLSFNEALEKASKTNQILFIQIESECLSCDAMAERALSSHEIKEFFAQFICIKVLHNSTDYQKLLESYFLYPSYPFSIFIDSKGNYLSSFNNFSTANWKLYIDLANKALAAKENPPFTAYMAALTKNDTKRELLKEFIIKLSEQNFNSDSLLDKYIESLTIKELSNEAELNFIFHCAPVIGSKAFKAMQQDLPVFRKVFETIPAEERIKINQKIFQKSKIKLFRSKDETYLYSVGNFLKTMYGEDKKEANRAETAFRLEFFKVAKKDFETYYQIAHGFYNYHYSKLNMDTIRIKEMSRIINLPNGVIKGVELYQTGNEFNNIACTIVESTSDKEQLGFALKLSEKTLKYNVPTYFDTYARILYRLGGRKDAIDWQKKAITTSDSLNLPNRELIEALSKMKAGTL